MCYSGRIILARDHFGRSGSFGLTPGTKWLWYNQKSRSETRPSGLASSFFRASHCNHQSRARMVGRASAKVACSNYLETQPKLRPIRIFSYGRPAALHAADKYRPNSWGSLTQVTNGASRIVLETIFARMSRSRKIPDALPRGLHV